MKHACSAAGLALRPVGSQERTLRSRRLAPQRRHSPLAETKLLEMAGEKAANSAAFSEVSESG